VSETVLVLGAGAREHAIVRTLARSAQRPRILCAPGNAGIAREVEVVSLDPSDPGAVSACSRERAVSLVVIGPEAPLVAGVADALAEAGIACFGPCRAAARLEGSKAFCKEVMIAADVPTPAHSVVTDFEAGLGAIARYPVVIKADGLAAGKGVIIAADETEARAALSDLLVSHRFGTERVVVEEYLEGEELSLLALCDGETALPLASAQDYKRIFDGDEGPNTGGMGSYSPVPGVGPERGREICAAVHQPVLDELARRGIRFHGVLYAGIMLTADGPQVLEFNVRFGDPETQAILPRLRTDLLALMQASCRPGGLAEFAARGLEWDPRSAVTVVLASAGYPHSAHRGNPVRGLEALGARDDDREKRVEVTHAGIAGAADGSLVTAGGRVLSVTALGTDLAAARAHVYAAAENIVFDGRQMRSDIALRAAGRAFEEAPR
jgi:phosphoribosylamine--glycine ligase